MSGYRCPRCSWEGMIFEKNVPGPKRNDEEKVFNFIRKFSPCTMTEISRSVRKCAKPIQEILEGLEILGRITIKIELTNGRPRKIISHKK